MSYSHQAKGATKQEAKDNATAKYEDVLKYQPMHELDKKLAIDAQHAAIDLLTEVDGKSIFVDVVGSLGYQNTQDGTDAPIHSVYLNFTAYIK